MPETICFLGPSVKIEGLVKTKPQHLNPKSDNLSDTCRWTKLTYLCSMNLSVIWDSATSMPDFWGIFLVCMLNQKYKIKNPQLLEQKI